MAASAPAIDPQGRFTVRAELSWAVIAFYLVLAGLVVFAMVDGSLVGLVNVGLVLDALILVFLARYVSTHYRLDSDTLRARRLFGSRTVQLEEVRRIEYADLRELGTVSFFGGWGWRGRVWSPRIGRFDSVSTVSRGILVSAGAVPVFISPRHAELFARELSRRVRSHVAGALEVDAGDPNAVRAVPAF